MIMNTKPNWIKWLPVALMVFTLCFYLSYCTFGQIGVRQDLVYRVPESLVTFGIKKVDALSYLKGTCVPEILFYTNEDEIVTIVVREKRDAQEWANALTLALGIIPESRVQEIGDPIPEGFEHVGTVKHNGHHPFREQRLISEIIKPIRFCSEDRSR